MCRSDGRRVLRGARVVGLVVAGITFAGCGGSGHRSTTPATTGPSAVMLRTQGLTRGGLGAVSAGCERAARTYRGTVYCPPIVPVGPAKVAEYALNHSRSRRHRSYLLEMSSPSLMGLHGRGLDAAGGHWTVAAGTDPSLRLLVQAPSARERPQPRRTRIDSTTVDVYDMPSYEEGGGLYGGHVVIAWNRRGVTYQVSIHDPANTPRGLLIAQGIIDQQSQEAAQVGG